MSYNRLACQSWQYFCLGGFFLVIFNLTSLNIQEKQTLKTKTKLLKEFSLLYFISQTFDCNILRAITQNLISKMASSSSQQVNQSNVNTFTTSTGHPISLVGTMGIVQTGQRLPQNINILQNQLTPQQIAALQQHQRSSPQHQLASVRPGVVNFMGNQSISLQNVQVLGNIRNIKPLCNMFYQLKCFCSL